MENSQPQHSSIPPPPGYLSPPSSMTPPSDHRHSLVAGRFRDALFSAVAAKYSTNGSAHSFPFHSEQFKSVVDCRIHENFPSFQTPTHLPYASMIQRAIAEGGDEDGLSEESISEFIVNEYEDLPWAHPAFLRRHLGKLCESGELVKSNCGRYNFKVEGTGVKRKKRRRKSAGRNRRRELESADEIEEDFDRKKRSKKLMIIGPREEEVVTSKGTEEQSDLLREVIVGAVDVDHAQGGQVVLDELQEIQEDEMIDKKHGEKIKRNYGPKDFYGKKQSPKLVIIGLPAPVAINEIEKQSGSLGEEVQEAEDGEQSKGGQIQVHGEVNEVQADVMIHQPCEKEVKSRDCVQDFDEEKQSQNVAAGNLGAQEALTMTRNGEKCGSLREEIDGAKERVLDQDRQVIRIYKLKEVRKVGMINDHHEVEVNSRDGIEDFGGTKQSQDLVVVGLHTKEALTTKGTEDQCSSLRKKVDGAEGNHAQAGQTEALGKFKEVLEVEMIDKHHEEERQGEMMEEPIERPSMGSNEETWPGEEAILEFFDATSNHSNGEENGVIGDAEGCKKLQEENENLEFFDARSDHDCDAVNEIIGAQSSKEMVLGEVSNRQNRLEEERPSKVSDNQTGIRKGREAEDPQLSKEHPQVRWPSEITGTPPKHSEQEMSRTFEADKNENSDALLPADIISGPSHPWGHHHGRGRPRNLKVQETLATSLFTSAQDCDPDMGDGTHHIDQQRLKLPRGRGRGRGRPRIVRQDQISVSEMFSPSKHWHHQQSPGKRCGRPPKQKFNEDTGSKGISTSLENEQQEHEGCGRGRGTGRPSRQRKKEKGSFDNQ
ncbi:uncharacterized protein LOC120092885 [Benincasa hispida]|uniref:uncharacterized protein LOC120092885 n=1 Tax=Benincasa hispida TaxID=102211 RepID=UPI0018FF5460|nr:uncharacterized protein LOC120092885 [Benincasa hispida]